MAQAVNQSPGGCACPGGGGTLPCSPCAIPKNNLTLAWTNVLIGNGSTPLVFNGTSAWNSACNNELLYALSCVGGAITFCVTYFLSGVCPTGQSQQCCYPGSNPFTFTLLSYQCSPFQMVFQATGAGCPVLWSSGYDTFTITNP